MAEAGRTPAERFAAGAGDFRAWLGDLPGGARAEFERHYREYEPAADDLARMERAIASVGGELRALVVTDAASPDDARGVGVMARIADACGVAVSIVSAADHADIVAARADLYGESGTPTFVFLDGDGAELGHLSRRPQQVEIDVNRAIEERHGFDFPLEGPEYEAAVAEYLAGDGRKREPAWRHAQLWEIVGAVAPEVQRISRGTVGPIGVLRRG